LEAFRLQLAKRVFLLVAIVRRQSLARNALQIKGIHSEFVKIGVLFQKSTRAAQQRQRQSEAEHAQRERPGVSL